MYRLHFSFYRALYAEMDMYETHFAQLQRDYARELRGEKLSFAIDFSELHSYIHPGSGRTSRAAINTYILTTLDNHFSLLPGAVGELLTDLERVIPRHLKRDFGSALYAHPAVVEFLSGFPESIQDEDRLTALYAKAEKELRDALGEIVDLLLLDGYASIQAFKSLLDSGKLTPIEGVHQISAFLPESKRLAQLVEVFLTVERPSRPENNQVDAIDFLFALLLNQQEDSLDRRYITIYSQAVSLIRACRSSDRLRWDNDYLIREAKYLQFRTKLQELFRSVQKRHDCVMEWYKLCQRVKAAITRIVDIDEQLEEGAATPTWELLDLYRKFDVECKQLLLFEDEAGEKPATRERAQRLYELLMDEAAFEGKTEEAYEVLKEHLRKIHQTLQAFTPASTDTTDIKTYKTNLRGWLGLDSPETSDETGAESVEEEEEGG